MLTGFMLLVTLNRFTDLKSARRAIYFSFFGVIISLIATFYSPDFGYDDGYKWILGFFGGGIVGSILAVKVNFFFNKIDLS